MSLSRTKGTLGDLDADISHYLNLSIAASTGQTYSSAEKRFLDFCSLYHPTSGTCLPATEDTLIKYAAFLARSIKYSSIKGYLAAVRHFHIRRGFELDLNKCLRLQLVCRGIKRSQGTNLTRVRLPITIKHLRLFHSLLAISYTSNYDSVMIWAAMTLAFFGFLRLGELTCNSKFSPEAHLSPEDVIFLPSWENPDHLSVRIKISKTDPFRSGQTILIGKTHQPVCPVQAMKAYMFTRDRTPGPLFTYVSGKPLTKDALTSETRQLLSQSGFTSSQYAGHSFRIGAATTAASVGLPPWLIKTLGRWSSDCFERYIRCPQPLILEVSHKLVKDSYH